MSENKQTMSIYVISDAIGETAQRMVDAVMVQFPSAMRKDIRKYPFIENIDELHAILNDAVSDQAILVTTFVNQLLNDYVIDFAKKYRLAHIDYMTEMMRLVAERTGIQPAYKAGALHQLDKEYFDRVAAIEFAVKYDDGKNPQGFAKSDIVLLGVSRTSKTPLSMDLANKSYKVSNLPLIPEVKVAAELKTVPSEKIFGLVASPEYIMKIRQERVRMLGLSESANYSNLARIKKELSYSEELFAQLGATVVSVENKSVEETAQQIELLMKDRYGKVVR